VKYEGDQTHDYYYFVAVDIVCIVNCVCEVVVGKCVVIMILLACTLIRL
jgi:hypothetical protein